MTKVWLDRVKYLQDQYWDHQWKHENGQNMKPAKPLLPLSPRKFKPVVGPDTEIIYDFEAQWNIYSISAFYQREKKLIIWYYAPTLKIDPKTVLQKAYKINGLTINTYSKELLKDAYKDGDRVKLECKELTIEDFRKIFERPKRYVVGFNSNYYDLELAAYILANIYQSGELPHPEAVRKFSNLLINPIPFVKNHWNDYMPVLRANHIKLDGSHTRLGIWQLDKIFEPDNNRIYPGGHKNPNQGTAPNLNMIFRNLTNTGLHLDMKLLNEKDKEDPSARYTSLKRISAQMGYQIEEPEDVNLDSDNPLTVKQSVTLLAYNASDVLVTTLIYHDKEYLDVLDTREGLLNRFDESNFKGRRNVNSTSAQFVEYVIAPENKLQDQIDINYFYPVHGPKYDKFQAVIDEDFNGKLVKVEQDGTKIFAGKDVPYIPASQKYANNLFELWCQAQLQKNINAKWLIHLKTYIAELNNHALSDEKQNKLKDQLRDDPLIKEQYYYDYVKDFNNNIADRDYLDIKWTNKLQVTPGFEPQKGRDGKVHQRFRVKYGEIQEDLLEYAGNNFKKFPDEVYTMYDVFRGCRSIWRNGELIKTAREVGVEKYVKKFSIGTKPLTKSEKAKHQKPKPIPPKNVYYKFRQGTTEVSGIGVIVQVPHRPMCLSFSVGGVHGEVIKQEPYERDVKAVNSFNKVLKAIKDNYPDAKDFASAAINKSFNPTIERLINTNLKSKQYANGIKLFIKNKNGEYLYKDYLSLPNPKDYVIPIDMHNAVHVDVDSLYPSLMINLHLFSTWTSEYNDPKTFNQTNKSGHWDDVYAKLRAERVRLKKAANSVPKEDWGPKQYHQWAIQLINKLLLNSASGIADGKWDTNVRVNNRATSMRIMGQLALTYLVYSVEPKGVYSTSTNTDGVYLTSKDKNFSEKDINAEIEDWKLRHHLGATPEIMSHFVSKDSNNRFEQENLKESGNVAGGTIGNAYKISAKKKMVQPAIVDATIIDYFKTHQNICTTYDIPVADLRNYIQKNLDIIINGQKEVLKLANKAQDKVEQKRIIDTYYQNHPEIRRAMMQFCWPVQPQKHQEFTLKANTVLSDYLPMQHVNRLLLVKHGFHLNGFAIKLNGKKANEDDSLTEWCKHTKRIDKYYTGHAYHVKVTNFNQDWQVVRLNLDLRAYFLNPVWYDIDLDAYTNFAKSRILGQPDNPIWVEKKFKPLSFVNSFDEIIKKRP